MSVTSDEKRSISRPDQPLVRFGGRTPFWLLRNEMDNLLSRFSGDGGISQAFDAMLDMSETENEVEVRMDVPGIQPEEIDVEVSGNTLIITGERKEEKEEQGKTFHRVERTSGSFSRSVTLPCEVERDQVEAHCDNGVLTILLPKSNLSKSHKITVKPKF